MNICHPSTGVIEQAEFLGVNIQSMEASLSPPEQRGWLSNNDIMTSEVESYVGL